MQTADENRVDEDASWVRHVALQPLVSLVILDLAFMHPQVVFKHPHISPSIRYCTVCGSS